MSLPSYKPANLDNKSVRKILGAALKLWTERGYHGASLKDIAEEAGVAKSLVHYHFESKEHLLIELQAVYSRQIAEAVRERLSATGPSVEAALAALDQVWDGMIAMRAQLAFALEVWRASLQNPAVRRRLHEFNRELLSLLERGLLDALGPLAHRIRLPPERVAALLAVALDGFAIHVFLSEDDAPIRRVFDDFKLLVRDALLPKGGAR